MTNLTRRTFFKTAGALTATTFLKPNFLMGEEAGGSKRRPNIIFILTDDEDFDEMSCYEGKMPTPYQDGLARDGIKFMRHYVASSLCGPSRFNLHTGRYASRKNILLTKYPAGTPVFVTHNDIKAVSEEKYTLASVLKSAGYATGMCGKWHQGTLKPIISPNDDEDPDDPKVLQLLKDNYENLVQSVKTYGYDYADGLFLDNRDTPAEYLPKAIRFHNMEWVANAAANFIDQNKEKPFFLFVAPTLVHDQSLDSLEADIGCTPLGKIKVTSPMPSRKNVLERAREVSEKTGVKLNKCAASLWMDDGVGVILNKLKELELEKDTCVILVSDNGNYGKMTCYEGGAHTPSVARFPGVIPPGTVCDSLVTHMDFVPTALALAGVKKPDDMALDGVDILSAFKNQPSYKRESLLLEVAYQRAVITDDGWKYLANRIPSTYREGHPLWLGIKENRMRHPAYDDQDQLYNLNADSEEKVNLFNDENCKERREKMLKLMKEYSQNLPHSFGEFTEHS